MWYSAFFVAVLLLWAFSSSRDKAALRVVLLATIGSFLITEGVTRGIHAPWKLVIPGLVETLTILSLLKWARNRTGFIQVGLLVIAWATHALCYYDLRTNSNLVYDEYETILGWLAVGQLAGFHDTFRHNALFIRDSLLRWGRDSGVPAPSLSASILHNSRPPSVSPLQNP